MSLTAWQRVQLARHPKRPHAVHFIEALFTDFEELSGDRLGFDDKAVIGGLAKFEGRSCVVIGQEKGATTEERLERNFGYMHPEGYRKAMRLMKMAEKFLLPVITLIDTPGAYPGLEAEMRGQGWAIAENLRDMALLETPIIALIIGEGSSGGAIGIGVADSVAILQNAYYSVITPEGCASILWKDAKESERAAEALKLNAEHLLEVGIVDEIIAEAPEGLHTDPQFSYSLVRQFLKARLQQLEATPLPDLLQKRYDKFRRMGNPHA